MMAAFDVPQSLAEIQEAIALERAHRKAFAESQEIRNGHLHEKNGETSVCDGVNDAADENYRLLRAVCAMPSE